MEIVWYGHSCFRLTERGMATVVTDPYNHEFVGYEALKLRGDIVTVSHNASGHNNITAVKGRTHTINGPGEYEIGGVFITGVQTNGKLKSNSDEISNTLYVIDYNGIAVAHLGNLKRVPSQTEIEAFGTVHVALVPVGGGNGLNAAKAAEVVSLLEPGYVVPMHYQTPACKIKLAPLSKFLKEMGLGSVDAQDSLKISQSSVPDETKIAVLQYNFG